METNCRVKICTINIRMLSHHITRRPVIFGLLWQMFGAAISLPLYHALHISWLLDAPQDATSVVDPCGARSIIMGYLFGALFPAAIGMLPTWTGAASSPLAAGNHQRILAVWQPDPLWVSWIIQLALLWYEGVKRPTPSRSSPWNSCISSRRVCGAYLLAGIVSTSGHLYTKITAVLDPQLRLWEMYVPGGWSGPSSRVSGTEDILIRGPWLFLQWDLIIISVSSLSWVFVLLERAFREDKKRSPRLWTMQVGLLLLVGSVVVGPGATVSFALIAREAELERSRREHAHCT